MYIPNNYVSSEKEPYFGRALFNVLAEAMMRRPLTKGQSVLVVWQTSRRLPIWLRLLRKGALFL